jgi:hypothetical protein
MAGTLNTTGGFAASLDGARKRSAALRAVEDDDRSRRTSQGLHAAKR